MSTTLCEFSRTELIDWENVFFFSVHIFWDQPDENRVRVNVNHNFHYGCSDSHNVLEHAFALQKSSFCQCPDCHPP